MIKKIITLSLILSLFSTALIAQNESTMMADQGTDDMIENADKEDYEQLLDAYLTVSFRGYAYEKLGLSGEEIIAFDPVYLEYMREKSKLNDRRSTLMESYNLEMAEDDRAEDEAEESADFIEDYWELQIAGDELRKNYFDEMEDIIPYQKAFTFFLLEESIENEIVRNHNITFAPVLLEVETPEITYFQELDRYNTWMQRNDINVDGTVSLDHAYTYDGLSQLTKAIKATANVSMTDVPRLNTRINKIMQKAMQMQDDAYADTHADLAKHAFTMTADLMTDLNKLDKVSISDEKIKQMRRAANKLDVTESYIDQKEHVYMFFTHAQEAINEAYTKESFIAPSINDNSMRK